MILSKRMGDEALGTKPRLSFFFLIKDCQSFSHVSAVLLKQIGE